MRPVPSTPGRRMARLEARLSRCHKVVRAGGYQLQLETLDDLDADIDQLAAALPPAHAGGASRMVAEICPHFGVVWPAALALCDHLREIASKPLGDVIELGCGLALPSMVARRLGAGRIIATDRHPLVPNFLSRNAARNDIKEVEYIDLDWRKSNWVGERFDLVIGSDLLYEPGQPGPLAELLPKLLKPGGRTVLADPGRRYLDAFVTLLEASGYPCDLDAIRPIGCGSSRVDVLILTVRG